MKIKRLLSEVPFLIFCVAMIPCYYNGFMYPEANDFWIVRYGAPILIFELFSIITVFVLLDLANGRDAIKPLEYAKVAFFPILVSFVIAYIFNIWMFPYFFLSISLKYFAFRKIKYSDELSRRISTLVISVVAMVTSMFIGFFCSSSLLDIFPHQSIIINQFITENSPFPISSGGDGMDVQNMAGAIMLWGVCYFIFLFLFTIIYEIKVWRKIRKKQKLKDIQEQEKLTDKICPNCGHSIAFDTEYCPYCKNWF